MLAGSGCDSGGSAPDPEVTVSAEAVTEDGSRVDSAGIYFDGQKVGEGTAQQTYTQDSDGSVTVSGREDDYLSVEKTVSLGADRDVSLELQEELPEEVTISFSSKTADSSVAGKWTWNGEEVVTDAASGTHAVSGSRESSPLCFEESSFFKQACESVTPTQDRSVEVTVERKQVTFAVTPVDSTDAVQPETVTWVYEPYQSDSSKIEGEESVSLTKRSGMRSISSDLIIEEGDSDKLDRYVGSDSVPADEDADLTVELAKLPACSDNLDNDGDRSTDAEDLGCSNDAGTGYDPEDDNETHYLFRRVTGVTDFGFDNDSTFVSGDLDKRTTEINTWHFPESITVAIGEVRHWIENERLADTSKQHFRMKVLSGPDRGDWTSSQTSDIVADPDTTTGWWHNRVHGLTRFEGGPWYKLVAVKAEPFGGPKNMAIFFAENADSRIHSWEYFFEKDHPALQDGKMAKTAPLRTGECRKLPDTQGKICNPKTSPAPPWIKY